MFFNSSVEITICMLLTFTATTPTSSAILITIFYLHYLLYNGAIFQSFPRPTFSIIDYLNRRQKAWLKLSIPRRFDFPKFYSLMNFQEEIPLRIKLFTQKSRAENKSSRKAPTVLQRSMWTKRLTDTFSHFTRNVTNQTHILDGKRAINYSHIDWRWKTCLMIDV